MSIEEGPYRDRLPLLETGLTLFREVLFDVPKPLKEPLMDANKRESMGAGIRVHWRSLAVLLQHDPFPFQASYPEVQDKKTEPSIKSQREKQPISIRGAIKRIPDWPLLTSIE